jgi:hypothetical protein
MQAKRGSAMKAKFRTVFPETAWAIFTLDEDDYLYRFHSAHWSRQRARELLPEIDFDGLAKKKIVKVLLDFNVT